MDPPCSFFTAYACFVLLFAFSAGSATNNFIFNGFQGASHILNLNGAARIAPNGVLKLTNDTAGQVIGQAFFSSPFHLLNSQTLTKQALSFSTTFVFEMVTLGSGGHAFTFAIAPSNSLPGAECCQYLGLLNKTTNGNVSNHIIAVKFGTVQDTVFEDIDDDHVGININSVISNVSMTASYYTSASQLEPLKSQSGDPIQAWIEYDGATKLLSVTIAPVPLHKPLKPLISKAIDLAPILKESMYVGFTSSTDLSRISYNILGWSFNINGVAPALNFSQLQISPRAQVPDNSTTQGTKMLGLKIGLASSIGMLVLVVCVLSVLMHLRQRSKLAETLEDWELEYPHRFPYKDLYRATKGFKETEILGSGGFGQVYKGILPENGEQVAIKRISNSSKQGVKEFIAEISSLGQLRHRSLVQLQGWCKHNEDLILVYDYMLNGSLDRFLFKNGKNGVLSWEQRFKIIKDIALGLLYLHEEWGQVIVHRDIKASNVLLDQEMNGKLGDFGLARFYDHGSTPHTTSVMGTIGYIAPELSQTGKATPSTDVFAFGVLVLEVVCGRRPIEPAAASTEVLLLNQVRQYWTQNKSIMVLDSRLEESYTREEVELALKVGLLCSQSDPAARPTMRQVTQCLNGHENTTDDRELVFSEADTCDLVSGSFQPSGGVLSIGSLEEGR